MEDLYLTAAGLPPLHRRKHGDWDADARALVLRNGELAMIDRELDVEGSDEEADAEDPTEADIHAVAADSVVLSKSRTVLTKARNRMAGKLRLREEGQ